MDAISMIARGRIVMDVSTRGGNGPSMLKGGKLPPLSYVYKNDNPGLHPRTAFSFASSLPSVSCSQIFNTNFKCTPISAVAETTHSATFSNKASAKLVAIVGDGSISPLNNVPWEEVMKHTAKRLKWIDEAYELLVFTDRFLTHSVSSSSSGKEQEIGHNLAETDVLIIINVQNRDSVKWVLQNTERIPTVVCFDCSADLQNRLGGLQVSRTDRNTVNEVIPILQGKRMKDSLEVLKAVYEAWGRHNTDDLRFSLLLLINSYIRPVPMLRNGRATGISILSCMIKNCGPQLLECLLAVGVCFITVGQLGQLGSLIEERFLLPQMVAGHRQGRHKG